MFYNYNYSYFFLIGGVFGGYGLSRKFYYWVDLLKFFKFHMPNNYENDIGRFYAIEIST